MYIFKLVLKSPKLNCLAVIVAKTAKQAEKLISKYLTAQNIHGEFDVAGSVFGYASFGSKPEIISVSIHELITKPTTIKDMIGFSDDGPENTVAVNQSTPINSKELGLSKRIQNTLINAHEINTVGELMCLSKNELLKLQYLGPVLVSNIISCLAKHKLKIS